jgi:hypothetical protein
MDSLRRMADILTCAAVLTLGSEAAATQTLDSYDTFSSARLSYRGQPIVNVDFENLTCEIFGVISRSARPYQAEQTLAVLVALHGTERWGRRQGLLPARLNPVLELGFVVVGRSDTETTRSPNPWMVRSRLDLGDSARSIEGLLLWSTTLRHCLLTDRTAQFISEDVTRLESALNDASRRERRLMSDVAATWWLWSFGVSAMQGGTEKDRRDGRRDCVSRRKCDYVAAALAVAGEPWYGNLPSADL